MTEWQGSIQWQWSKMRNRLPGSLWGWAYSHRLDSLLVLVFWLSLHFSSSHSHERMPKNNSLRYGLFPRKRVLIKSSYGGLLSAKKKKELDRNIKRNLGSENSSNLWRWGPSNGHVI